MLPENLPKYETKTEIYVLLASTPENLEGIINSLNFDASTVQIIRTKEEWELLTITTPYKDSRAFLHLHKEDKRAFVVALTYHRDFLQRDSKMTFLGDHVFVESFNGVVHSTRSRSPDDKYIDYSYTVPKPFCDLDINAFMEKYVPVLSKNGVGIRSSYGTPWNVFAILMEHNLHLTEEVKSDEP